jgi:hypothetical protein
MWIMPPRGSRDLSAQDKRVLRDLRIDANGPGTILRDFTMLLDFVQSHELPVTKAQQLPLAPLPEINSRMTRPLNVGLKRAVQKSYPHINGLYLLLRASGLATVEARGKKLLLRVDPAVAASFGSLNDTEQYFALLEAWLLRGWPDIVLEGGSRYSPIPGTLQNWSFLFAEIPEKGTSVIGNPRVEYVVRYNLGWHNLALLELFGLITTATASKTPGAGWCIERIQRTPLGDVLLVLIEGEFVRSFDSVWDLDDALAERVGVMQTALQPYFPEWKNNIAMPELVFQGGVHTFRVSLGRVWFRIAMPAEDHLDSLASAILSAVHFDSDHLYRFEYRDRFGAIVQVNHPYMEDGPWVDEVQIGELEVPVGQPMTFLFDFGDMWEFDVVLEKIDPEAALKKPVLVERHGEPPEQYPGWEE